MTSYTIRETPRSPSLVDRLFTAGCTIAYLGLMGMVVIALNLR